MAKILRARTVGKQPRSVRFGQSKSGDANDAQNLRRIAAVRDRAFAAVRRTPIGKGAK